MGVVPVGGTMTAWLWLMVLGTAGASPVDRWTLVAHPPAAEDARSAEARAAGASGDAAVPACHRVATGLLLCAADRDRPGVIAMRSELAAGGTSLAALIDGQRNLLEARWADQPAGAHQVEGMKGRYFVRAAGDGFDAAGVLRPDLLADLAEGSPVVAIPEDGTLLWWVPGDGDFDKVVAVGVKRMADASSAPVSARIYRWSADTAAWTVWGQVRGTIDLPVPTSPEPTTP